MEVTTGDQMSNDRYFKLLIIDDFWYKYQKFKKMHKKHCSGSQPMWSLRVIHNVIFNVRGQRWWSCWMLRLFMLPVQWEKLKPAWSTSVCSWTTNGKRKKDTTSEIHSSWGEVCSLQIWKSEHHEGDEKMRPKLNKVERRGESWV